MRIVSDKYTAIGGRIGSMVGLMNRSGMCFRNWVVPANPDTSAQQGTRATLSQLATAWGDTLTSSQRAAWEAYAATLEFTSKLGTPYTISGFNAYCAGNGARMVAGLSRIDDGPTTAGFDTFTAVVPVWDASDEEIQIAYTNTDGWAGEVGGALTVRKCPLGISPGVTFYEGPFIYADKELGAGTPPTSPLIVSCAVGYIIEGIRYAIAVRSVRADGRWSKEVLFPGTGAA
ncbi:MAG: hypothetical protein JRD89_12020 [Deltaproteobacteria bacterium]|nr:hypothetical protein [Deltaproteobacteria bacterium]